jgi:hypothetical protein
MDHHIYIVKDRLEIRFSIQNVKIPDPASGLA